jgi:uncharacterized protein (TIGR02271 family)
MQHDLRRLGELRDFAVAKDDPDVRGWGVRTRDGRDIGEVEELIIDPAALKVRYLEVDLAREQLGLSEDRRVSIPVESAEIDRHRHTVIVDGFSRETLTSMPYADPSAAAYSGREPQTHLNARAETDEPTLTRAEEELRVGKRQTFGEVVVGKHLETDHISQPVTVEREQVRVERRPVADDVQNREVRMENGEIRIPITEEEIVVEKRPVVKEELVVSKETVRETRQVEDDVRRERFDIRDEGGRVVHDSDRTRSRKGGA